MIIQDIVTLKAKIQDNKSLSAKIEVLASKGSKGDQGISGNEPQPYAVSSTVIPASSFWIRSNPRLANGQTIEILDDAKLIVI